MQDLTKLNRDYVWCEVSDDREKWYKRAVIHAHSDGSCYSINDATTDDHQYIIEFKKGRPLKTVGWKYHRPIKEKQYRAFTENDNWKEYFRDRWVKNKKTGCEVKITSLDVRDIVMCLFSQGYGRESFKNMFENFENLDGTPLGVEIA